MDYGLRGKVAIVTGGGGSICGEIARALALEGVSVAIWDVSIHAAEKRVAEIRDAGGKAIPVMCDVLNRESVDQAMGKTLEHYGTVDILINGAGGSRKEATTSPECEFFDLDTESIRDVFSLNYMSAVIPSQVVGRIFAQKKSGVILNITSVAGIQPLTMAVAYSSGKAAANNFTQWLAVHMAKNFSPEIRVNAIAPGFILTQQNRFLLIDEKTGTLSERGKQVIRFVPMGRLGKPEEIVGAAIWLVSDCASFVTGAVVPVDGGFTAFSGV